MPPSPKTIYFREGLSGETAPGALLGGPWFSIGGTPPPPSRPPSTPKRLTSFSPSSAAAERAEETTEMTQGKKSKEKMSMRPEGRGRFAEQAFRENIGEVKQMSETIT